MSGFPDFCIIFILLHVLLCFFFLNESSYNIVSMPSPNFHWNCIMTMFVFSLFSDECISDQATGSSSEMVT